MTFLLLASAVIIILISVNVSRQKKTKTQEDRDFWAREQRANSVRRKSLDGLNYISIPLESFPTHLLQQDEVVLECIDTLEALSSQKIVNLSGYTNTDLKLEYGTANITELSQYDQNYTVLVRTLQKWADVLIETGYLEEASVLMEFAVSTGTDVSRTYYELAGYWASQGEREQIRRLKKTAVSIRSANGNIIRHHLEEEYPDSRL